jgi:hypothetical protein
MVGQWQTRIGDGKLVGKFGERVQQLLDSVRKSYNARTVGSLTVRDRAERARQLDLYLASAVSELFRQQLENLQASTTIKFRKSLVKLAASPEGLQPEEEQQLLRKALFDLLAETSDLEVESLGLSSAALQTQVSTALQALLTDFPETAAARLEEVRKVEKNTKKPPKRKGQRAVNIGLNLVGMLRPPGFGNLQGFMGYSTGFMGLPLELLLGVQNDGDSPEVIVDETLPLPRNCYCDSHVSMQTEHFCLPTDNLTDSLLHIIPFRLWARIANIPYYVYSQKCTLILIFNFS